MRFGSSEERRPRDASPVSVVFGVDRCQVFGVAARTTTSATPAAAAAAAFVVWVPLVASPKKHENRFCTYSHKLMQPCRLGKMLLVTINLARLRLVWSRQLATGMVQHARVVVAVGVTSYYHHGTIHILRSMILLLLLLYPARWVGGCVRSRSSGA